MRMSFFNQYILMGLMFFSILTSSNGVEKERIPNLNKDTIDAVSRLPIQYGGRLMPLDTFARLKLHRYQGGRSVKFIDAPNGKIYHLKNKELKSLKKQKEYLEVEGRFEKKKLSPAEWLYYALFWPELANDFPVFLVDNSAVVTRVGMEAREQRDRYTYNEISPHLEKLIDLGSEIQTRLKEENLKYENLEYQDQQLLNFANNVYDYTKMVRSFETYRPSEGVVFKKGDRLSEALSNIQDMSIVDRFARDQGLTKEGLNQLFADGENNNWDKVKERLFGLENEDSELAVFKLPNSKSEKVRRWVTPSQVPVVSALFPQLREWGGKRAKLLEDLAIARDPSVISKLIEDNSETWGDKTVDKKVQTKLEREHKYNERNGVIRSLAFFILGFLVLALSWTGDGKISKWISKIGYVLVIVGLIYLIGDIISRCLIRGRPPISNLYETILFVGACMVGLLLIFERVLKNRISLSLASIVGAISMFVARKYELHQADDTMEPLRAVLDTNFWLSTHVTIINIGYAAGVLAAVLSHAWIFLKLFKLGKSSQKNALTDSDKSLKQLTKAVYGVICFCLLFSLVGTILGGIWANDSWGRFWGWDPKENGALMIVLWAMVILHARLGGYFKDFGIHIGAIILGSITIFSWFGTNNLGIGLHSYGFTSGLWKILYMIWGSQIFMIILALAVRFFEKTNKPTVV